MVTQIEGRLQAGEGGPGADERHASGGSDPMRIVELSDHPGDLLRQERHGRAAAAQNEQAQYEQGLARHERQVAQARRARDQARAEHRWWAWLRGIAAVSSQRRRAPVPPRLAQLPSDQEEILQAGIEGERLTVAEFDRALDGQWTLFRGYRNRRGEIDHLLLGPAGLIAVEGKHRNAMVDCAGDQWWFTKYDRYGNPKERGAFTDQRGRSPSEQLNQPADMLEDFLRSRGHPVAIRRVVLFTHPGPGSEVAPTRRCTSRPRPTRSSTWSTPHRRPSRPPSEQRSNA
jgi:hypothetical protein